MTTNSMRSLQQKDHKPYKTRINQVHMLSLPILSLNTKFQPNWLQNIKAREVFIRVLRDSTPRFVSPSVGPSVRLSVRLSHFTFFCFCGH